MTAGLLAAVVAALLLLALWSSRDGRREGFAGGPRSVGPPPAKPYSFAYFGAEGFADAEAKTAEGGAAEGGAAEGGAAKAAGPEPHPYAVDDWAPGGGRGGGPAEGHAGARRPARDPAAPGPARELAGQGPAGCPAAGPGDAAAGFLGADERAVHLARTRGLQRAQTAGALGRRRLYETYFGEEVAAAEANGPWWGRRDY